MISLNTKKKEFLFKKKNSSIYDYCPLNFITLQSLRNKTVGEEKNNFFKNLHMKQHSKVASKLIGKSARKTEKNKIHWGICA